MSKTYTGPRTITAKLDHLGRDGVTEWWYGYIDGHTYYGLHGNTEAEALAKAGRAAARMDADAAIYPAAKAVAGNLADHATKADATAADFFVGQRVGVYSRGDIRIGLVEKVGKTNITVVYVTASTGNLWRKADKFAHITILESAAGEELAAEAATETCYSTSGHRIYDYDAKTVSVECDACGATFTDADNTGGLPAHPKPAAPADKPELMTQAVREAREPGFIYTPDPDGPVVEPATLARYEAEVAAKAQEAARTSNELCDHVGTERVERTAHGYLGDAPKGTRQVLCGDCGAELDEPPVATRVEMRDVEVGQGINLGTAAEPLLGVVERVAKTTTSRTVTLSLYVPQRAGTAWSSAGITKNKSETVELWPEPVEAAKDRILSPAGLKAERDSLRARTRSQDRPELDARLEVVEARIAVLIEAGAACVPTGEQGSDGRDHLACGSIANPAGNCCEHGVYVRPQPQSDPVDAYDDDHLARYDDDPSPYAGTYSEE